MADHRGAVVGRRAFRIGGAAGLALGGIIVGAIVTLAAGRALGAEPPDALVIAVPLVLGVLAFVAALRAPPNRATLLLLALGIAFLVGGLLGAATALGGRVYDLGQVPDWALLLLGFPLAALGVASMLPWWNRTDEAARTAHTSAFFWGGSAGALVVLPLIMAAHLRPGTVPEIAAMAPEDAFFAGAVVLYLAICLGYVLFWAWWWLSRTTFGGRS